MRALISAVCPAGYYFILARFSPLMRRGNIVATDVWVLLMRSERDIATAWVHKQLHWYYARIARSLYWAGIPNA